MFNLHNTVCIKPHEYRLLIQLTWFIVGLMMVRGETTGAELCFQTVFFLLCVLSLSQSFNGLTESYSSTSLVVFLCVSSTLCLFIPPIQCLFFLVPRCLGLIGLMAPSGREDSWMLESWEHTECQTIWSCSHRPPLNNFICLWNVSIT